MNRIKLHDLSFVPFLSKLEIQEQVTRLGKEIAHKHASNCPIFICILNGAFVFAADLMRAANIDSEIAFMKLSSYEGTSSTGIVKTVLDLNISIENRHIIIVEDIVDTGHTMKALLPMLAKKSPASISIATLLLKPDALQYPDLKLDYVGFEIPSKFVVGYGLDYDELGRNLEEIYQLKE